MKKVKYKITTSFANLEMGQIVDAYILSNNCGDEDRKLLYHPKQDPDSCSCLEICSFIDGYWVSLSPNSFVNLSAKEDARIKLLMVWE